MANFSQFYPQQRSRTTFTDIARSDRELGSKAKAKGYKDRLRSKEDAYSALAKIPGSVARAGVQGDLLQQATSGYKDQKELQRLTREQGLLDLERKMLDKEDRTEKLSRWIAEVDQKIIMHRQNLGRLVSESNEAVLKRNNAKTNDERDMWQSKVDSIAVLTRTIVMNINTLKGEKGRLVQAKEASLTQQEVGEVQEADDIASLLTTGQGLGARAGSSAGGLMDVGANSIPWGQNDPLNATMNVGLSLPQDQLQTPKGFDIMEWLRLLNLGEFDATEPGLWNFNTLSKLSQSRNAPGTPMNKGDGIGFKDSPGSAFQSQNRGEGRND